MQSKWVSDLNERLFNNTSTADAQLIILNGAKINEEGDQNNIALDDEKGNTIEQSFPIHKAILSSQSEYFLALFFGPMKKKEEEKSTIGLPTYHLDHVEHVEEFEQILKFCYSGKIDITIENFFKLWKLADFFQMQSLQEVLKTFDLSLYISLTNVCEILINASKITDLGGVVKKCVSYFHPRMEIMFSNHSHLISMEFIQLYLLHDELHSLRDSIGFEFLLKWHEKHPEISVEDFRSFLRDHMAWHDMTHDYLADRVFVLNILSKEELFDVFMYSSTKTQKDRYQHAVFNLSNRV
jgi:hypothetical protein